MKNVSKRVLLCMIVIGLLFRADCPSMASELDVAATLDEFAKAWPESRVSYRNAEDTTSWKSYALAMKRLVAMGDDAVPGLIEGCRHSNYQLRGLSARVLGFLQAKPAVPMLIELLDDKSLVACLAADSLGQIQDPAGLKALQSARGRLRNGDVLLHINKALDRDVPLEDDVREQILKIGIETVGVAEIGELAPDFTLKDSAGTSWVLSDFRGKKSVVLVFIYGDG